MSDKKTTWEVLSNINVNDKTEKKGNLTYLSWAWAWGVVKGHFSSANYKVIEHNGKPYLHDEALGYMVNTEVTIDGETIGMHLPVMDFKNQALKQATMTDINKAIMRCLAKNLAMFGLGHYIYAGEDLPTEEATTPAKTTTPAKAKQEKAKQEKPTYSDNKVSEMLETWKGLIDTGKNNAQGIIDAISTKHELTKAQKVRIMELG